MKRFELLIKFILIGFVWILSEGFHCQNKDVQELNKAHTFPKTIEITQNVIIENYFQFMDSLVQTYDPIMPYTVTEHLLVRSNPWIIDTLQNTDYYRMKAKDSFIYNQKKMMVLSAGSKLIVPDVNMADSLQKAFKNTYIDINIPEYKLRIYQDSILVFEFPIRVGRNEKKYLEMSGREEDLRTKTGTGTIVGYNKNPRYANPSNNHDYKVTRRDDGKVTLVPQIPFIETELNGIKYGQMIHPTTNPETLGKAYSNGCIGVKEADAWVIYYHAPLRTRINIRYDLETLNQEGELIMLPDIYKFK